MPGKRAYRQVDFRGNVQEVRLGPSDLGDAAGLPRSFHYAGRAQKRAEEKRSAPVGMTGFGKDSG